MLDFVVIGAAQAGLSMAYYLQKHQKNILVVDKASEIGASWLERWDSLRLFTPSEFNDLPGMAFPAPKGHYPSKYEVADYFKTYVEKFNFPIQLNTFVAQIKRVNNYFLIKCNTHEIKTKGVVVATGPFHIPFIPSFSCRISPDIYQIHSSAYKNPNQLKKGPVLVVGDGDSGFQILDEISACGHKTYFSGSTKVSVLPQEFLNKTLWWWLTRLGYLRIKRESWLGKRASNSKQPIIGTPVKQILKRKNVIPIGYALDASEKLIMAEKRKLGDVHNVIWATGYRPHFSWIEELVLRKDGYPEHVRGISSLKHLYFIGLPWLNTRGSATLGGIKKDAKYLADYILKTSYT